MPTGSLFTSFEPTSTLIKIKIPVLAFFNERDLLVQLEQNLPPFSKALAAAGNKDYTILQMPELNHRFQHCKIGTEKNTQRSKKLWHRKF